MPPPAAEASAVPNPSQEAGAGDRAAGQGARAAGRRGAAGEGGDGATWCSAEVRGQRERRRVERAKEI